MRFLIRIADHVIWATALEQFATSDSKSKFSQSRSKFRSRCRSESEDGSGPAHPASHGRHEIGSNPRHTANGRCSRSQGHATISQTDAEGQLATTAKGNEKGGDSAVVAEATRV
jgi:hypothetical protein